MLTALYRNDRPGLLLSLPLWCVVPWLGGLLDKAAAPLPAQSLIYGAIARIWAGSPWSLAAIGWFFTMVIAAQLVFLVNDAELGGRRNHLPVILFPLLLALRPGVSPMGPELLGMPLVLWAMRRLWLGAVTRSGLASLFDTGLLIGAASMLHLPYVFLLVVVWATNAVMRPFHWRDHLVPVVGVALVRFAIWGGSQVAGIGPALSVPPAAAVQPAAQGTTNEWHAILLTTLFACLATAAAVAYVSGYRRSVMQGKNMRSALLALLVGCALLAGFHRLINGSYALVILAVPGTLLLCPALSGSRRTWLSEAGVYFLLAMALWAQCGTGLSSPA